LQPFNIHKNEGLEINNHCLITYETMHKTTSTPHYTQPNRQETST